MKTEPNAEMRALATMMWQMYTAMIDEGFTEVQALQILSNLLVGSMRNSNDD
jgi:hypothetical protein